MTVAALLDLGADRLVLDRVLKRDVYKRQTVLRMQLNMVLVICQRTEEDMVVSYRNL